MCKIKRYLLVSCILLMPQLLSATVYYVATTGYDSYNGLYPSYQGGSNGPFRTLGKAASTITAGDSVQIRGGTYQEKINWSRSGTAVNRITIDNYEDETVIIDGGYTLPGGSVYYFLVTISGSYVTLRDITIKRSSGSLFMLDGSYSYAINITGIGSRETGMCAGGNYNLFDGCTMSDNGNGYGVNGQGTWGSAICTVGSNTTIQNCISYENRGEGFNAYSSSSNSTFQDNISYNNRSANMYLDSSNGSTVRRNLVYQTKPEYHQYGITIGAETGQPLSVSVYNNFVTGCLANFHIDSNVSTLSNVKVVYNTFVNSVGGVSGYNMGVYYRSDTSTYSNSTFKNNLVTEEDPNRVPISVESSHSGLTFSNNCWNKTPIAAAQGALDIIANPLLAKTGLTGAGQLTPEYFKILANSPARDRATVLSEVAEDFFRTPRGSSPDMGGYEFSTGTSSLAASASGSPTSGQAPLSVNFTGSASGGTSPYSYRWTFGDGTSSTTQSPSHTYSSSGSYTATLAVTDSASATASKSVSITATAAAVPLAATASASPTSGQAPLAVSFTGSASGGASPYSYRWTFGDGGSSTSQSPSHTYSSAGSYTATFTVTDSLSATASKSVSITATAAAVPLSASASASPTSGQAPLAVSFTGGATGGSSPYTYRWTFGDSGSSTSQSPSHTYSSAGGYTATLTVTDSTSTTASKSLTITASSPVSQLVATASASPTSGQAPLAVSFTGSATGGASPYSYSWNFGDGGSSTSQSPSHTYSSAGGYTATLTVTDSSSTTATATASVTVGTVSGASLTLTAQTGAPAPGTGGTTDPAPGTYNYSIGSTVQARSIPNTNYRFSKWDGNISQSGMFSSSASLVMDNNKSLTSTFCTICADVTGDLRITPADAQAAFDIYLKRISSPTWCEVENADVNSSGTKLEPKVTPSDAQMIFHKYLRRGTVDATCSGDSRATTSTQNLALPAVKLAVGNSTVSQSGDILIPIIVESPSAIGAFGFDLVFSSKQLTFVGFERTDLTSDFDQLDANVFPYLISQDEGKSAQSTLLRKDPSDSFDREPVGTSDSSILRVGGYKTDSAVGSSSGVIITLVFRVIGGTLDSSPISIVATYDDIHSASITDGAIEPKTSGVVPQARQSAPEKRVSEKR